MAMRQHWLFVIREDAPYPHQNLVLGCSRSKFHFECSSKTGQKMVVCMSVCVCVRARCVQDGSEGIVKLSHTGLNLYNCVILITYFMFIFVQMVPNEAEDAKKFLLRFILGTIQATYYVLVHI